MIGDGIQEEVLRALVERHAVRECLVAKIDGGPNWGLSIRLGGSGALGMETVEPSQAYINPNQWTPPIDAPDMPEPLDDPDRAKWAEGLSLTPEQKLVRETKECTLANYRGGPGEQGGYAPDRSPASTRKPTVADNCCDRLL